MDLWNSCIYCFLNHFLFVQGPGEQPAIFAQTATGPHVAAVGLLHRRQHHLDGVPKWRSVSVENQTQSIFIQDSWIKCYPSVDIKSAKMGVGVGFVSPRLPTSEKLKAHVLLHNGCIFVLVCDNMYGGVVGDSQSCYVSPRWAWVLQDALGIAFCLYMLKTVRLPTFKVAEPSHRLVERRQSTMKYSKYLDRASCWMWLHLMCFSVSAGLHPTADSPFCLRRLLRIYHTLLNKCAWRLLRFMCHVSSRVLRWLCLCLWLHRAGRV